MIAACPKCSARYRVDPERIGPDGARLKCAKCTAVFRVRAPESAGSVAPPPSPGAPEEVPAPVEEPRVAAPDPPAEPAGPLGEVDRTRLVVIADPEPDSAKTTAAAITSWGLQPIVVHDGVEAMLTVQRMLPQAVILDAALPKMYGFQVCEVIKRNESLREMTVALVGAIHHKDRYRRPPSELYGADHYLERPDLPDGLIPILRQAGMSVGAAEEARAPATSPMLEEPALDSVAPAEPPPAAAPAPPAPSPAQAPAPAPTPVAAPEPPAAAAADDGLADQRAKAERLARIIVSDILLYNAEKFEAALPGGNVLEALDAELEEGRSLFVQRVDAGVRDEKDYLAEELERVARERGQG
ncbi:MAG: zinc-ribbon domain-containing protein [Myxococcota bacterium]